MPNAPRGHVSTRSSSEPAQNARLLNATYRLLWQALENRALNSGGGLATTRACMAASNEENDMTKINTVVADHLSFQAHHLFEQSLESPEYKERNEAAAKELEELETLFRNDDVDPDLLAEFAELFGEGDGATSEYGAYKRVLEDVGFGTHYDSAEAFLGEAVGAMKRGLAY
jgi:hypothetical protein